MSNQLLVIGHGTLPADMVRAAEMIYGPTEGVSSICLPADQDLDAYRKAITQKIEACGKTGLLVLADIKGGTPFLTASRAMRDFWNEQVELVTGLNLPMLTEVFSCLDDDLTVRELAEIAVEAGALAVTDFRSAVTKRHQEVSA